MSSRASSVGLALLVSFGCGDGAPPPAVPTAPLPTTSATPTTTETSATASATPSATPSAAPSATTTTVAALKYPPKSGYLERAADGSCGYRVSPYWCPAGAICKPTPPAENVRCPRSIQGKPKGPPAKPPSELGWLELEVDGTCWWSKEAPAECSVDAPCAPLPPSHQVLCHP